MPNKFRPVSAVRHEQALSHGSRVRAGVDIMVVEDDDDVAHALSAILAYHRCRVTRCADACDAVKLLHLGLQPEVILLDLWTPQMNGWEFRLEQRGSAEWAYIPVVVLSADASAQAAAIDADAYLLKPIEEDALLSALGSVLQPERQSRARPQPPSAGGVSRSRGPAGNLPARILLVDDDPRRLAPLRAALSGRFEVHTMRSEEALEHLFCGGAYDMVLRNNARGDTGAIIFLTTLALRHPEQAGRVVLLQDFGVDERLRRALEDAGVWQLDGPWTGEDLVDRLTRMLQLWSALKLRGAYEPRTGHA
ncbi:MAG: Response regulator [Myxococcaceae bacterium]|nr:Response regulator [Myxococcaceae bacterium]